VAQLLKESWRPSPAPPGISAEGLAEITDILLNSGAGSLAWHRVRDSDLRDSPAARQFRQMYRYNSLQVALRERSLVQVFSLFRRFGVEPMLVKGWAVARHYAEPGLRPCGDLDLCVLPEQRDAALAALNSSQALGCDVDLHVGFGKFYDRRAEEVYSRSQLVRCGEAEVRVPAPEDHLRFLCTHLLRHGAARPIWVCDLAVALETRNADFDWDRCLSGGRRQADWVACAIGLAHQLLNLEVDGTPVARRAKNLPSWLLPAVLQVWGTPFRFPGQITAYLRRPLDLVRELPRHWPNPIEATAGVNGRFTEMPRLPFQIGHVVSRGSAFLAQLPKLFGGTV